jgi:hypothetical protein
MISRKGADSVQDGTEILFIPFILSEIASDILLNLNPAVS